MTSYEFLYFHCSCLSNIHLSFCFFFFFYIFCAYTQSLETSGGVLLGRYRQTLPCQFRSDQFSQHVACVFSMSVSKPVITLHGPRRIEGKGLRLMAYVYPVLLWFWFWVDDERTRETRHGMEREKEGNGMTCRWPGHAGYTGWE
jgi:hypothetical protein